MPASREEPRKRQRTGGSASAKERVGQDLQNIRLDLLSCNLFLSTCTILLGFGDCFNGYSVIHTTSLSTK